jgi:hypothetical protein
MNLPRITPWRAAACSLALVASWKAVHWFAVEDGWEIAADIDGWGWAAVYLLGFCWLIWGAERLAQGYEAARGSVTARPAGWVWNPFDTGAWFYGRRAPRLRQTLLFITSYSLLFVVLYLLMHPAAVAAEVEPFELPSGGGSDQAGPAPRAMRVQKQVRRKFAVNPYSSVSFTVPTIDQLVKDLGEATRHEYRAGYGGGTGTGKGGIGRGTGKGSGFGSGTGQGKVRLPRLRHPGRNWDKNHGINGDYQMLDQHAKLTEQRVAEKTEVIEIGQLARLRAEDAPPLVVVTGSDGFPVSPAEKKILKQYLLEKSGMILGDNLGGGSFHNQFIQAMRDVTGVQEVPIPRDDYIHARPFLVPSLPFVVNHGGTVALGWKVEGRWVAYYHPGALTDAWEKEHAGIKRDIWEACYLLGSNIINYAYSEKDKWFEAQRQR